LKYEQLKLHFFYKGVKLDLALTEEHRLSEVFEKRGPRGIFGNEKDEVTEGGKSFIKKSFIIYNLHRILLGRSNRG
jgi:hypothetical protein